MVQCKTFYNWIYVSVFSDLGEARLGISRTITRSEKIKNKDMNYDDVAQFVDWHGTRVVTRFATADCPPWGGQLFNGRHQAGQRPQCVWLSPAEGPSASERRCCYLNRKLITSIYNIPRLLTEKKHTKLTLLIFFYYNGKQKQFFFFICICISPIQLLYPILGYLYMKIHPVTSELPIQIPMIQYY